jgi:ATP-dependent helicase/DNAse subunit B
LRKDPAASAFAALYRDDARFQSILEAGHREEGARLTDGRIIQKIAEEAKVFSASRLESFLTCAFRYFAEHSLKLRPPFEDRLKMEMGTLLHAVLEDFYANRRSEKQALECLENEFEKSPLALEPLYRRTYLLEQARRTLEIFLRSEKEASGNGFTPAHFELAFGKKRDGTPAELPSLKLGKENVLVNGFIDRVDVSPDGRGALVIDYKLSKRDLNKKVNDGLEVQLPLYLMAVRDLLGLEPAGGELRFLKTGTKAALKSEGLKGLLEATETRVLDAARRIRSGDIAVDAKSCQYCHFSPVCRFEPWKLIYSEVDKRG